MQTPSIGRIVHYKAPQNDEYPAQTLAALITRVGGDGEVDLCIFGKAGFGFRSNVPQGDGQSHWDWPVQV